MKVINNDELYMIKFKQVPCSALFINDLLSFSSFEESMFKTSVIYMLVFGEALCRNLVTVTHSLTTRPVVCS